MSFRLLIAGFPFVGKTGTLPALANAGYTLRYINADAKTTPLYSYAKPEARKRIQVVDCIDELKLDNGKIRVVGAQGLHAWTGMIKAMDKWPVDGSDPRKWGDKDVLVIDSVTEIAKGYARRKQVLNNRQDDPRYEYDDYTDTQKNIDALFTMFKTWGKFHVIAIAHLQIVGPDLNAGDVPGDQRSDEVKEMKREIIREKLNGAELIPWKMGVVTLGKAQATKLGQHFDGAVLVKDTGGRGRKIMTQPEDGFDAGIPLPDIARELPIETGLATIFDAVSKLRR